MSGTECVRMVAQKLLAGSSSLGALEALLLPRGPASHFSRLAAPTTTQRALDRAPCRARRGAWSVRGETNREARGETDTHHQRPCDGLAMVDVEEAERLQPLCSRRIWSSSVQLFLPQ